MAYKRGGPLINFSLPFRLASALMVYLLLPIAMSICVILYSVRYINKKKLAHFKGNAVLVSNHTSMLDPVMVVGAVFPRFLYETMLEVSVEAPFLGTFTRLLGGVPLAPGQRGLDSIVRTAPDAFRRRNFLHFYPEGECYLYNQKIMPFKSGAFYIAARMHIPIIPIVTVLVAGRVKAGSFFARKFPLACYIILEPLHPERYVRYTDDGLPEKHSVKEFAETTRAIMQNEIDKRHAKNPHWGTMAYYKGHMPRIKGLHRES